MKNFPDFYGVVTLGARGQVVIPSKARKMLKVKSGDTLVVMSRPREPLSRFYSVRLFGLRRSKWSLKPLIWKSGCGAW